jgi:hypothetical protein
MSRVCQIRTHKRARLLENAASVKSGSCGSIRPRRTVAELLLDKRALQAVVAKKW